MYALFYGRTVYIKEKTNINSKAIKSVAVRQYKTKITLILIAVFLVMCNLLSPFRNKFNCIAQNGR